MTETKATALFGDPRFSLTSENMVGITPSKLQANTILTEAMITVSLAPKTAAISAIGINMAKIGLGLAKTTRKLVSGGEGRVHAELPDATSSDAELMNDPPTTDQGISNMAKVTPAKMSVPITTA